MKNCGIYIIKNKINEMVYVGQSVDIPRRWYAHIQSAKNLKANDHYTKIHMAMYQLGIENFYYKILEECKYEQLNKQECYWIEYYNSYNNGYNMTLGGEQSIGETNPNHKLLQSQVVEIRLAYASHIPFREVYEKFKNNISKRGLQKVWHYETWLHILPEVYTDENREWHRTNAKANIKGNTDLGNNNKQRACSNEEIEQMRSLRKTGLSYNAIAQQVERSAGVVRKYCLYQEAKTPNGGQQVQNIETSLIFSSLSEAAKWANCDRHTIAQYLDSSHSAGKVQSTGQPAHWKKV